MKASQKLTFCEFHRLLLAGLYEGEKTKVGQLYHNFLALIRPWHGFAGDLGAPFLESLTTGYAVCHL